MNDHHTERWCDLVIIYKGGNLVKFLRLVPLVGIIIVFIVFIIYLINPGIIDMRIFAIAFVIQITSTGIGFYGYLTTDTKLDKKRLEIQGKGENEFNLVMEQFNNINDQLAEFRAEMNAKFAEVDAQFVSINGRLDRRGDI